MRLRRAAVASVAVHAAVWVGLAVLPDPPTPQVDGPKFADVELYELQPFEPDGAAEGGSPPAVEAQSPTPVAEPGPQAADEPKRRARPPKRRRTPVAPDNSAEPAAPVDGSSDSDSQPPPAGRAPGAVALSGLRRGVRAPRPPRGAAIVAVPSAPVGPRQRPPVDDTIPTTPAEAGFVRDRRGRLIYRDPDPKAQWTAELRPDGTLHFTDRLATKVELEEETNRATLRMGTPADRVRRRQGMKLWVQRKKKLLAATAPMRLNMAVAFAEKNIDRQLSRLHRDLLEIWSSDKPPHTRRGLIFETWDDCEDGLAVQLGDSNGGGSSLDELRLRAGTRARAKVIAFIRRHLPADSPDAFTARELVAMNERRNSRERFAPYEAR